MKLNKLGYLIKEGFRSVFKHGFMSFASVTIIIACLVIMGSFALLAVNIDNVISELESQNEIIAYVDEKLTDTKAMEIEEDIEKIDNISEITFVSREEAMDDFMSQYDDQSIFEDVEASVLRHRYVIYLEDISLMAVTAQQLREVEGIARVNASLEIAKGFITARNIVSAVSLIIVVILAVVSVFIMSNTIKLTTFGRREEIAIMKMVGAGNGFICFPFIVEGLILGIIGAAIAFFIEWGVYTIICDRVMAGVVGNILSVMPFGVFALPLGLVYLCVGAVVGAFGGIIAIRNYLKV